MYGGRIKADSTIVPGVINRREEALNEKKTSFFETGPNLGYAYTLVIKQNFYITGSASGSLDYGFSTTTTDKGETRRFGFIPNTFLRLSTGYNSANWALNVVYVNNGVKLATSSSNRIATLNSGNLRVNYVRRFVLGRTQKKRLDEIIK